MTLTRTILFCIIALFTADFVRAEEPFTAEVYLMGSDRKVLLYRKHNEAAREGPAEILGHVYTTPRGERAVVEEVTMGKDGLARYVLTYPHIGCGCKLEREGDKIVFSFTDSDNEKRGSAPYRPTLVVGPLLADFIHSRWSFSYPS